MSEIIIGKVSLSPCGEFQFGTFYKRLSVVNYLGSYYVAAKDNQSVLPTVYGTWFLISEVGNTIENIVLVSTSGNTSTYRINFTNGDYFDFEIENNLVTKTSEITNDSGFITSQVDDLTNYVTKDLSGSSIEFSLNSSTYVITVKLLDSEGNAVSTQTVSLPLSSTIVGATYQNATVTLSTKGGSTIPIAIDDIVPTSRKIAGLGLAQNISASDLIAALSIYTSEQLDNIIDPMQEELILMESNFDKKQANIVGNGQLTDSLNGGIFDPTLKGNTTQYTTTGKQLFDKDTATYVNNKIMNQDGVETSSTISGYTSSYIQVNSETAYTMQGKIKSLNTVAAIYYYDGSKGWISKESIGATTELPYTFTTPLNCAYIRFQYTIENYDANTIMIEQGSTASPYEPYTGGQPSPSPSYPQNIVDVTGTQTIKTSNKNIIPLASGNSSRNYYNFEINNDILHLSNATSGNQYAAFAIDNNIRAANYGPYLSWGNSILKTGTYTFSYKYVRGATSATTSDNNFCRLRIYGRPIGSTGDVNILLASVNCLTSNASTTFTINQDYEVNIVVYVTGVTSVNIYFNTQLEQGSTATDYVPHKEQNITLHLGDIHLRKIGDYQDAIFCNEEGNPYYDSTLEEGAWYLHKKIGDVALDGSSDEDIVDNGIAGDLHEYRIEPTPAKVVGRFNLISNYFTNTTSNTQRVLGSDSSQRIFFRILQETASSVTAFKTWLSNNNTTVCYILETPTTTEITSANYPELYADLEALTQLKTYKYFTNISIANNNGIATILDFIYWGSDSAALQNRITTLESEVALLE